MTNILTNSKLAYVVTTHQHTTKHASFWTQHEQIYSVWT